ncbi:phosphotransferase [Georgenia sp. Z1344]|uniref:phosphotransferase n=1 Tax=Georgenia sp. Z1344 TaxID=3416706 RepID=UPI003CEDBE06
MTRSPIALAALATLAVPGLDVVATRPPVRATTDFQTTGVLDARGRHWVVRMPRTAAAGASLEGEVALLERLGERVDAGELPFDVERPAGFTVLPEGGRAMVSRELPGRAIDPRDVEESPALAEHLGRALAALHSLDTDLVGSAGLPVYDMAAYRARRLTEVDEASRTRHLPAELVHRWESALESDDLWPAATTVVHGDLDAELVRASEDRVVAMSQFGDAHVGDPAEDLAWLVTSVEPDSVDEVLASYARHTAAPEDPFLLDRAQLASELLLTRWLMFGLRTKDDAVVGDAREMLDELARDVADAPSIGAEMREHLGRSASSGPVSSGSSLAGAAAAGGPGNGGGSDAHGDAPAQHGHGGGTDDDPWGHGRVDVDAAADVGESFWPEPGEDGAAHGAGPDDDAHRGGDAPAPRDDGSGARLDTEAWPAFDVHPGEPTETPGVPEPTAATADLTEEYEQWRREGREI